MGNDEHSGRTCFKKAVEEGARSPLAYCDPDGARVSRQDLGAPPMSRSTTSSARPEAAATASASPRSPNPPVAGRGTSTEGVYEGLVLTASAARSSSRRRISSTATARCTPDAQGPEWIREKKLFLPAVEVSAAAGWITSRAHPEFPAGRTCGRNDDPQPDQGAGLIDISVKPRGNSRGGIPLPFDIPAASSTSGSTRHHQLRVRRSGLGGDQAMVRKSGGRRICTSHRQGHHAVSNAVIWPGDAEWARARLPLAEAGVRTRDS